MMVGTVARRQPRRGGRRQGRPMPSLNHEALAAELLRDADLSRRR